MPTTFQGRYKAAAWSQAALFQEAPGRRRIFTMLSEWLADNPRVVLPGLALLNGWLAYHLLDGHPFAALACGVMATLLIAALISLWRF